MKIAVTGKPGIGKTTLCLKVYQKLKDKIKVDGFITKEVRDRGIRIGFKIVDLKSGEEFWLAKVGIGKVKVGKYVVFVENIDRFADKIREFKGDLIIVDEVGPMELKSEKFIEAVNELVDSRENLLFTVHYKSKHWLVEKIRKNFKLYVLNEENRNKIADEIADAYDL